MATSSATLHADTGFLLLADISGYTMFLETVTAEHPEMTNSGDHVPLAYPVLSSLLDAVVDHVTPTFALAAIEGDAVFAYAVDDRLEGNAEEFLGMVSSAYGAFRERIDEAMILQKCDCQACDILPSLDLKFLVHHGTYVVQPIGGQVQLAGPVVNVVHRLLKNSVIEHTGRRAYLFATDAAAGRLDLAPGIGLAHEEHYTDVGFVAGIVIGLDAGVGESEPGTSGPATR